MTLVTNIPAFVPEIHQVMLWLKNAYRAITVQYSTYSRELHKIGADAGTYGIYK